MAALGTAVRVSLACITLGILGLGAAAAVLLLPLPSPYTDTPPSVGNDDRPNILLIVVDDMGYNDLGANGSTQVTTPNLDRLAAQGVRFTRNYVNSSCTVSRAGMLTGIEPAELGFRPDSLGISPDVITLPESLRAAGYSTHHVGKWHLGYLSKLAWPTRQGFDSFFGFLAQNLLRGRHGGRSYFQYLSEAQRQFAPVREDSLLALLNDHILRTPRDGKWVYTLPTYRDPWLQFDEQWPVRRPGYLGDIISDHTGELLAALAEQEAPWFVNVWTFAPHAPVEPQAEFAQRHPDTPEGKYLALIEQLDSAVGRMITALDNSGQGDNTLVMVVSDNGGTALEFASNAPFRGGKSTYYEGGVRTPLILRWPRQLSAGQVVDAPVSYLEYFPTLAAAAGAEVPGRVTGRNLLEVVDAPGPMPTRLYWDSTNGVQGSWSILTADGRWRLGQEVLQPPELYDLQADPGQTRNLIDSQPEMAASLRADFNRWRTRAATLDVRYTPLSAQGRAQISGSALQRTPGASGYTFAVAVVPADASSEADQYLAYQRNQWSLLQRGDALQLNMQGLQLAGRAPVSGACSTVIVTGFFSTGQLNPKHRSSQLQLYVNGELQEQLQTPTFAAPADDYLRPTFVGQDDLGRGQYLGVLGRPVLLNQRVVPAADTVSGLGPTLEQVEQALCPGLG